MTDARALFAKAIAQLGRPRSATYRFQLGPSAHTVKQTRGEGSVKPPRTRPGAPYPLGATWDGAGVNFALFSEHATAVDLCLFDPEEPARERHRVRMHEHTNQVWHVYLPEARPGLPYGYRVHGPYEPENGHRFNPAKLLLDPYAKAINGSARMA